MANASTKNKSASETQSQISISTMIAIVLQKDTCIIQVSKFKLNHCKNWLSCQAANAVQQVYHLKCPPSALHSSCFLIHIKPFIAPVRRLWVFDKQIIVRSMSVCYISSCFSEVEDFGLNNLPIVKEKNKLQTRRENLPHAHERRRLYCEYRRFRFLQDGDAGL